MIVPEMLPLEKLKDWLEDEIDLENANLIMYTKEEGTLVNWEELVSLTRCRINVYEKTLNKLKRLENVPQDQTRKAESSS